MSDKNYQVFIQRFTQYFQQEIKCEDSDLTLQTIITLMNKCGLKDFLDHTGPPKNLRLGQPTGAGRPHVNVVQNDSPQSNFSASPNEMRSCMSQPTETKRKNWSGYHLFMRERKQEYQETGGPKPNYNDEWKALGLVGQAQWKEKAITIKTELESEHI